MRKAKIKDINIMIWAVENMNTEHPFYIDFNVMKNDKIKKHRYNNKSCALALLKDAQEEKVELWLT